MTTEYIPLAEARQEMTVRCPELSESTTKTSRFL